VAATEEVLRIGELSKRVGVSPELLRAWERRYGLLRPARSAGGLRLYSPADVERVALMQRHLAEGLAAAEAAALAVREAVDEEAARTGLPPAAIRDELADALDTFDEPRAQAILDRLVALVTVETPGEQHDLGLIAFGLGLRSRGWRIVYLGPDSPIDTVADVSRQLEPSLVVLNAVSRERLQPVLPKLRELARRHRVGLGGAAADDHVLEKNGILALPGDPTAEAARITTLIPTGQDT
jgi:DNA-binding transcriptional MerR regulator